MTTPLIEVIYFPGCPNVDGAREAVRSALALEGFPESWREWDRDDPQTPGPLRRYGSPTVLVDGLDVAPASSDAACCRVYTEGVRLLTAPTVEMIRSALHRAAGKKEEGRS